MARSRRLALRAADGTVAAYAIVSAEDYAALSVYRWWRHSPEKPYPVRKVRGRLVFMHREVAEAPVGVEVDHRNRNKLDCRRENLRLATHSQNKQNLDPYANNTSGHRGVSWNGKRGRWEGHLTLDGRAKFVGRFKEIGEAVEAVAEMRQRLMPFSLVASGTL